MPAGPNLQLALTTLEPADRAAVARWCARLGLELEELGAWPALARAVVMLAAVELMGADRAQSRTAALEAAGQALGVPGLGRSWYRMQRRALTECQDAAGADIALAQP